MIDRANLTPSTALQNASTVSDAEERYERLREHYIGLLKDLRRSHDEATLLRELFFAYKYPIKELPPSRTWWGTCLFGFCPFLYLLADYYGTTVDLGRCETKRTSKTCEELQHALQWHQQWTPLLLLILVPLSIVFLYESWKRHKREQEHQKAEKKKQKERFQKWIRMLRGSAKE